MVAELLRHLLCCLQLLDLLFEFAPCRLSRCSRPRRRDMGVAGSLLQASVARAAVRGTFGTAWS